MSDGSASIFPFEFGRVRHPSPPGDLILRDLTTATGPTAGHDSLIFWASSQLTRSGNNL